MSMIAYFYPADADFLGRLSEASAEDWYDLTAGHIFDMDKVWHGIHYLLTGSGGPTSDPLSMAIMATEEKGPDLGYGRVRVLKPEHVLQVSEALSAIDFETLRKRYNPTQMNEFGIYPTDWDNEDEPWIGDLAHFFPKLVAFYRRASTQGVAVVQWIG